MSFSTLTQKTSERSGLREKAFSQLFPASHGSWKNIHFGHPADVPESCFRTKLPESYFFFSSVNTLDIHLSVRMCKSRSCIIHNKQISSSHFATTEFTHPTSICLTLQTKKRGGWWTQGWTRCSHCKQHHYQVRESPFTSHFNSASVWMTNKFIRRNGNAQTKLSVTFSFQKIIWFSNLDASHLVWFCLLKANVRLIFYFYIWEIKLYLISILNAVCSNSDFKNLSVKVNMCFGWESFIAHNAFKAMSGIISDRVQMS